MAAFIIGGKPVIMFPTAPIFTAVFSQNYFYMFHFRKLWPIFY